VVGERHFWWDGAQVAGSHVMSVLGDTVVVLDIVSKMVNRPRR
jgi:hypothetical protein